jgi:hypothetical protein
MSHLAALHCLILKTRAAIWATTSFRCTDAAKIFHDVCPFEIESELERSPSLTTTLIVSETWREQRGAETPVHDGDVGFRLDQQTADFKAAVPSRVMQWSLLTAKETCQHAQTEFATLQSQ